MIIVGNRACMYACNLLYACMQEQLVATLEEIEL